MVNLLEAKVEKLITAACAGTTPTLRVVGFWDVSDDGTVKTNPRSCVGVVVMPRENETWGLPMVTLHAAVSVMCDQSDDPTGAVTLGAYAAISELFVAWQKTEDVAAAALSIADEFQADAVLFAAGGDCGYDENKGSWYATIMLDIKGCVLEAVPINEE